MVVSPPVRGSKAVNGCLESVWEVKSPVFTLVHIGR